MSVDKLVDSAQLNSDLTSIANAIRTKGGTSAQLAFPADFISAINAISGGGGWTDEEIATAAITGDIVITGTQIKAGAFWGNSGITSITGANVTTVSAYALRTLGSCVISLPKLSSVGDDCFGYTEANLYFPELTSYASGSAFAYAGATGKYLALPNLTGSVGEVFRNNRHTILDLGSVTTLGTRCLYQGNNKTVLILRASSVVTASATNAIATINSNTTVYVPSSLVSSYAAQTNWAARGCSFAAIEGSPYESKDWPVS